MRHSIKVIGEKFLGWSNGDLVLEGAEKLIPKVTALYDAKNNEENIFEEISEFVKAQLKGEYDEFCTFVVDRVDKFQHILT